MLNVHNYNGNGKYNKYGNDYKNNENLKRSNIRTHFFNMFGAFNGTSIID